MKTMTADIHMHPDVTDIVHVRSEIELDRRVRRDLEEQRKKVSRINNAYNHIRKKEFNEKGHSARQEQ